MRVHGTEWIVQQVDISVEVHSTGQAYTLFLSTAKVYALHIESGSLFIMTRVNWIAYNYLSLLPPSVYNDYTKK